MQFFLHSDTRIRIVNGELEFECTPERFAELETEYPGLPEGGNARYWTPEQAYFEGDVVYDGHECGVYCERVAAYTQYPVIYADVQLSKSSICACDALDSIQFTATLQATPIDYDWFVRLTHESSGDVDRILMQFQGGACSQTYTFLAGNPLGTWFLDESKFDVVEFGGQLYQVRLVSPVQFVAYRNL